MQMVIFKYMSIWCFTLFFGSNNCDQLLKNFDKDPKVISQIAACISRRLTKDNSLPLERHYTNCSDEGNFPPLVQVPKEHTVELLCRSNTNLVFRISNFTNKFSNISENNLTASESDQFKETGNNQTIPTIVVLKIYKTDDGLTKQRFYLANSSDINIENLNEQSNYTVSIVAISGTNTFSILLDETEFSTLPNHFRPGNIDNITVLRFEEDENDHNLLKALIEWKPADDMTCSYDVMWYLSEKLSGMFTQEIRKPEDLYVCTIEKIAIGEKFSVGVRAINKYDPIYESDMNFLNFEAPSCLYWYKNNLTICAPEKPSGLHAYHTYISDNLYSINVSWDKPDMLPDYYQLDVIDINRINPNESFRLIMNISAEDTGHFYDKLEINGFEYEIHLMAFSKGGNMSAETGNTIDVYDIAGKNYVRKLLPALVIPIVCTVLSALVVLLICHRRAKYERNQERCKYFEELEKRAPVDPNSNFEFPVKSLSSMTSKERLNLLQEQLEIKLYINDVMEIDRENIILLDEILGEGAFGLVRKGIAKLDDGCECDVAIKMLKDNPSIEDIKEFRREIDVMKFVGDHPNIVGIIGHCTKNISEMLLLTEYCSRGNLLQYLRSEWNYHQNKPMSHDYPTLKDDLHTKSIFNFDMSFIDKISISYKNIGESKMIESPDLTKSYTSDKDLSEKLDKQHIFINNDYELNGPCTNACKCQVDIIPKNECLKIDDFDVKYNNKVEVKGCKCRVRMLTVNELGTSLAVENHGYYKLLGPKTLDATLGSSGETIPIEDQSIDRLTSGDLLRMAKQIALGMEFLSKNKVVHRDLAARNVLVCENKDVKIADFGLSRDIYQENIYKKTGNGKLPIKWLALESMTHQVYTTHSDVWSYGILLYEIVTLGGTPYPMIPTNRIMKLLKAGYRMEKPKNCSDALYDLMQSCWKTKPTERPTFTEIVRTLNELIVNEPENEIIDLSLMEHIAKRSKSTSEESYLKPI